MQVSQILAEIDNEIARLQQARRLLAGDGDLHLARNGTTGYIPSAKKKRTLSADSKKRIAEAMKRRWNERRKLAAKAAKVEKAAK